MTATPCRHGPPLSHPLAGDVIGFSLRWDGQTGRCGSRATRCSTAACAKSRSASDVGTAVVHLGGVRFPVTGPLHYTMTAKQAVELLGLVRPRTAIPIHYEGWQHFREGREAIERELRTRRRTSAEHPLAPDRRGSDARCVSVRGAATSREGAVTRRARGAGALASARWASTSCA